MAVRHFVSKCVLRISEYYWDEVLRYLNLLRRFLHSAGPASKNKGADLRRGSPHAPTNAHRNLPSSCEHTHVTSSNHHYSCPFPCHPCGPLSCQAATDGYDFYSMFYCFRTPAKLTAPPHSSTVPPRNHRLSGFGSFTTERPVTKRRTAVHSM